MTGKIGSSTGLPRQARSERTGNIKIKLGVLVSGSGTNLQSIIDHCLTGKIDAEIAIVIGDKPNAFALERAKKAGISTAVFRKKAFETKNAFEDATASCLEEHEVDLVCLAGFMRIFSPYFLRRFPGKIINIHPALLPSFPGLHGPKQAFNYGVKVSGCTVHFVDEGTDTGPIIIQETVPVEENDTEESLAARILEKEHLIYPRAIQLFAEGRLEIKGRRVVISN